MTRVITSFRIFVAVVLYLASGAECLSAAGALLHLHPGAFLVRTGLSFGVFALALVVVPKGGGK